MVNLGGPDFYQAPIFCPLLAGCLAVACGQTTFSPTDRFTRENPTAPLAAEIEADS